MPEPSAMITADNACAVLVGHQPGLNFNTGDISLLALRNNSIALAKGLLDTYDARNPPWAFLSLIQKSYAAEMKRK